MVAFSRWTADISMRSLDILQAENYVDPKFTIGSIGMSKPRSMTLNYMYYGFPVRKEIATKVDGFSIDYVYPGCNGKMLGERVYLGLDYRGKVKAFQRVNHPGKKGKEKPSWLEFCRKAGDWVVNIQNEDGGFYRAYNTDGSMRMDSKANTPSIIRFLVQLYLVTGDERYKAAALKAGEWSYENVYLNMEYRGGTCDNADIQDKESGIYALFEFLALYDLTNEHKWLEAAVGAADYDEHYLDFAKFIYKNTRQSNDVDGSIGYIIGYISVFTNKLYRNPNIKEGCLYVKNGKGDCTSRL